MFAQDSLQEPNQITRRLCNSDLVSTVQKSERYNRTSTREVGASLARNEVGGSHFIQSETIETTIANIEIQTKSGSNKTVQMTCKIDKFENKPHPF